MSTAPGDEGAPQAVDAAWGASPSGVRDLVLDTAAEGRRLAQAAPRVSDDRLRVWLESAARLVAVRTGQADLLPAEAAPGWALDRARVDVVRRHLCELYAAALLADVTHPQLARQDRSPGEPLERRFKDELAALAESIADVVRAGPDVDPSTPGAQGASGVAWSAPPSPGIRSRRF